MVVKGERIKESFSYTAYGEPSPRRNKMRIDYARQLPPEFFHPANLAILLIVALCGTISPLLYIGTVLAFGAGIIVNVVTALFRIVTTPMGRATAIWLTFSLLLALITLVVFDSAVPTHYPTSRWLQLFVLIFVSVAWMLLGLLCSVLQMLFGLSLYRKYIIPRMVRRYGTGGDPSSLASNDRSPQ